MGQTNKTKANHAFVVRGTLNASDAIIEAIEEHDGAELVYQRHSQGKLIVTEEE